VDTNQLAPLAIITEKIANKQITSDKIADAAVGTLQLADDAVTSDKIKPLNVDTAQLANDAVSTDKLEDASVTGAKVLDGTLVFGKTASTFASSMMQSMVKAAWAANWRFAMYTTVIQNGLTSTTARQSNQPYAALQTNIPNVNLYQLEIECPTDKTLTRASGYISWQGARSNHAAYLCVQKFIVQGVMWEPTLPNRAAMNFYDVTKCAVGTEAIGSALMDFRMDYECV
jgi:hypothetical protein